MQPYRILWADDEIDLLTPHILFLEQKGYNVIPVNSGSDAIDRVDEENFDVIFLDENMPGMTGLETLDVIKSKNPNLPVVMITKSEEEQIMEDAIGGQIADYLIKPLNPNQILLSVKRILDNKRLVSEKANVSYRQEFMNISSAFGDQLSPEDWAELYKKLVYWELQFDESVDQSMAEVLQSQHEEANANFARFIVDNYTSWLDNGEDTPLLSHRVMEEKVFPEVGQGMPVFLVVIDNLRYDQWKIISRELQEHFNINTEESYYSILPTTTAYSRNAIFSGLLPDEMAQRHPDLWVGEDVDDGKNNNEHVFLKEQIKRLGLDIKFNYNKIKNVIEGKRLVDNIQNLLQNDLSVVVYNFVDVLSHARTEMAMVKELAPDESAYRSITRSWFQHSPLFEALKLIAEKPVKLIVTTDHGTIRVKRPFKIIGDRNTNTNLRYKQGKNLNYEENEGFSARSPEKFHLPKTNVSTTYVFAIKDFFFAYPNNFNYYVNYYRDTFQHGGVSMEEMIIPIISLTSKNG